ncbi:hypothetical protein BKA70DRAFT_1427549 [Coprinopsis sp. MPI-PUGE-AT-0042]|nr:hypothetical protein BKA70DRAFT_1427549 [Coprinopsis sp. MPI-PUGE-AT-0042]
MQPQNARKSAAVKLLSSLWSVLTIHGLEKTTASRFTVCKPFQLLFLQPPNHNSKWILSPPSSPSSPPPSRSKSLSPSRRRAEATLAAPAPTARSLDPLIITVRHLHHTPIIIRLMSSKSRSPLFVVTLVLALPTIPPLTTASTFPQKTEKS